MDIRVANIVLIVCVGGKVSLGAVDKLLLGKHVYICIYVSTLSYDTLGPINIFLIYDV